MAMQLVATTTPACRSASIAQLQPRRNALRHLPAFAVHHPAGGAAAGGRERGRAVHVAAAGFGGFGKSKEKKLSKQASCPCGSGKSYKECCRPYHDGEALPPTPEALMRSRYSAYAKGEPKHVKYVCDTTHPDNPLYHGSTNPDGTPSSTLAEDVVATCRNISWDRLKVLSAEDGSSPNEAFVTFQTWFKVRGQEGQRAQGFHTQSFIEHSRFLKEGDKWLYVNGDQKWVTGENES